jgi:hypothetical protein
MPVIRPERLSEIDQAAAAANVAQEVEGDIREFVRRDVSVFRRSRPDGGGGGEMAVDNINGLIQRVAGQSIGEIEHVIGELTRVRDMLRSEGERVQREISGYASLSQAAMTSMKIIADSLAQWQPTAQNSQNKQNGSQPPQAREGA